MQINCKFYHLLKLHKEIFPILQLFMPEDRQAWRGETLSSDRRQGKGEPGRYTLLSLTYNSSTIMVRWNSSIYSTIMVQLKRFLYDRRQGTGEPDQYTLLSLTYNSTIMVRWNSFLYSTIMVQLKRFLYDRRQR